MSVIMKIGTLDQLPPEILGHCILALLDAYDLVRVRKTCKALKATVDTSEMLQYIIDLGYFRMIPVGTSETDASPATCRKRLRQQDAAWQHFEYKKNFTLHSTLLGSIHDPVGGMFGSIKGDCIYFARLPSLSDSVDLHCWNHPVDGIALLDFTFCPAQDLLVLVASPPGLQNYEYDIHLRSLTTNDAHPDAAQPILKALNRDDINRETSLKIKILGNYISMLRWNVVENRGMVGDYLQMWDWKSKMATSSFFCSTTVSTTAPSLQKINSSSLTHTGPWNYIPFLTSRSPRNAPRNFPYLLSWMTFHTQMRTRTKIQHLAPCSPILKSPCRQSSCLFHPSTDDQLITIIVGVARVTNTSDARLYRFFARCSAILKLESLFSKTYGQATLNDPKLPWSMWGPQHTTWFRVRENAKWGPSLYGFRTVTAEHVNFGRPYYNLPEEPCRLFIRDFNPHIAWNYGVEDTSGSGGRIVRGKLTRRISRPFTEPLGSALTYRETISEEMFDVVQTLMDESRILLPKVSRNLPLDPSADNELR
ncbi:hypothetical protein EDB19DRAFT_1692682 [Suillus lakei]|nr:hypothetical protein EDB19DRAFT_1692682 [Suillus lakei]